ncbi:pseudouridine-5'-phosphate glycosidase [Anaerobranca californiensis DSM 14826]|jgi:pseudouridine-5'-phosphate glycosidase|uniref:Pseudouridine-5'-phosphate glycosidase n=1 Tax=Anaerobranca californiensis DSM 14826 TaxID=1120989 RepID=A0A1M6PQ16_9FIRM|nr:pseudouridine-5'-phosphate glycosidase [Anaerobranca californiensis]SHK10069.1 pseudouridine-5'-phosphate glycosidase [Anaerobranca californiensis DSM 14826]
MKLSFSLEVKKALEEKKPVVALESTIISHGMPYPKNYQTALEVERIVRENGAIPATIAIIGGTIKVGLSQEEIDYLAKTPGVYKVSRRDLPFIVATGKDGATTVSGTMIVAAMAGIKVFATGGIGGVHIEGENTMDISADLTELGQTDVAVVCAGVKSILDIGRTLEYLETLGVPVITYKSREFPAFFSSKSGFPSPLSTDKVEDIANTIKTKYTLGLKGGVVIANPIPEEFDFDGEIIGKAIRDALKECKEKNIRGKEVTPFLLQKIVDITGGKSLQSNIALVKNNAKLAADIAKLL